MGRMLALLQTDQPSANSFGEERSKRRAVNSIMRDIGTVVAVAEKLVFLYGTCGYGFVENG